MNWIDVNDGLMLNIDELRAISKESESETRIFTSESDSFVAPITYETLRAIIRQKRSLEKAAHESFQSNLSALVKGQRSLVKGQRTPAP